MWTERASLSLNKQMRKEALPNPSRDLYLCDHTMGFSIPAINLPLFVLQEKKEKRWGQEEASER